MERDLLAEGLGYFAAALVFTAFYMRTMVPLRLVAIASNIAFLGYALGFGLWPVAVLHGLLLPLNTLRLVQIRRMLSGIAAARHSEVNAKALAQYLSPITYTCGAAVFHKGEHGDSAYFVVAGEIVFPEFGARCGSGDLFGEIAIFSPEHVRTASAICATDVELYRIDEQAIVTATYQDPALAFALLQLVTRRLLHNLTNIESELLRLHTMVERRA